MFTTLPIACCSQFKNLITDKYRKNFESQFSFWQCKILLCMKQKQYQRLAEYQQKIRQLLDPFKKQGVQLFYSLLGIVIKFKIRNYKQAVSDQNQFVVQLKQYFSFKKYCHETLKLIKPCIEFPIQICILFISYKHLKSDPKFLSLVLYEISSFFVGLRTNKKVDMDLMIQICLRTIIMLTEQKIIWELLSLLRFIFPLDPSIEEVFFKNLQLKSFATHRFTTLQNQATIGGQISKESKEKVFLDGLADLGFKIYEYFQEKHSSNDYLSSVMKNFIKEEPDFCYVDFLF